MLEDEAKIRSMYDRWSEAVRAKSIDGYIGCLDEKITMRPPGGPTIDGHDAYRQFLKPVFESASYERTTDDDYHIEIFGDFAIVRIRQTIRLTLIGGAVRVESEGALQKTATTSDYLDVLKRQDDGEWKCLVHTWKEVEDG